MPRPIVNLDELEYSRNLAHGDRFEARFAPVGPVIGAVDLGYNVTEVAPGKRAFPFHNHHANEEMFFILEGEGTLRFGDEEHSVRQGDFIACPNGGPEVAHQLINTSASGLRYLAVSAVPSTDVVQYPDSGKVAAVTGLGPGKTMADARFAGIYDEERKLGYWDDE